MQIAIRITMFFAGAMLLHMLASFLPAAAGGAMVTARAERRYPNIDAFMALGGPVRVIAHRGFSGVAPENTLAAFSKAIEVGADMLELDVLLSRDGAVIVIHDDTLERTTDGEGNVEDKTLAELQRLDAGSWFAPEFAGEPLPTLDEVLALTKGKILVNIEIKSEAVTDDVDGGITQKVLSLVARHGMQDQIVISSFNPQALTQVRQLSGEIRTASLYNSQLQKGLSPAQIVGPLGANGFNLSQREVNAEIVSECHGKGWPVAVYTANEVERMQQLMALGVDALITDRPNRVLELLATK